MDENWGGTVMDQKDIAEVIWALHALRNKISPWMKRDDKWVAPLAEATEDIEHIIDFLEPHIED